MFCYVELSSNRVAVIYSTYYIHVLYLLLMEKLQAFHIVSLPHGLKLKDIVDFCEMRIMQVLAELCHLLCFGRCLGASECTGPDSNYWYYQIQQLNLDS